MKQKLVVLLLITMCNFVFAQDWIKQTTTDRWGDVTGNSYIQLQNGEFKKGLTSEITLITFGYFNRYPNALSIASIANFMHPGYTLFDENIKFSIRQNGKTVSFSGINKESNDIKAMGFAVISAELIEILQTPGTWDVLIEGDSWYIRTKISGGLPK